MKTVGLRMHIIIAIVIAYLSNTSRAYAYTSLISSTDFAGVSTDVTTAVGGVITIALILLGAGLLLKVIMR